LRTNHQVRLTSGLVATVVFLTAIAPLATDMYVPAFPRVAHDLTATATQVQLTLTTFFVGMGFGQLIGGPVSDQRGRRRPLLAAILVMTAASVACAISPTITVMTVARLAQGFSGGWAMVIGRAVIIDLATGSRLIRVLNLIAGVGGIAPIVGPLLGALILQVSHWRVSFWVVAALGVAMTICVLLAVPESLPPERRHGGGLKAFAIAGRQVLGHRRYIGYLVVSSSAMAALFAYVATSAFVLQSMNGLPPIAYSVDFAANAGGLTIAALAAAHLVWSGRHPQSHLRWAARRPLSRTGDADRRPLVRHPTSACDRVLFRTHDRTGPHRSKRRCARVGGSARPSRHELRRPRMCAVDRRRLRGTDRWSGRRDLCGPARPVDDRRRSRFNDRPGRPSPTTKHPAADLNKSRPLSPTEAAAIQGPFVER